MRSSLTSFVRLIIVCVVVVTLGHLIGETLNHVETKPYRSAHLACLSELYGDLSSCTPLFESRLTFVESLSLFSAFPFPLLKPPNEAHLPYFIK